MVGDTPLGVKVANKVREHGVDTRYVEQVLDGRTGLCYTEQGGAPRATHSWYDMKDTAFRTTAPEKVDWSSVHEASIFHVDFTGPMLDSVNTEWMKVVLATAQTLNAKVSVLLDISDEQNLNADEEKSLMDLVETAGIFVVTLRALKKIWGFNGSLSTVPKMIQARFSAKNTAVVEPWNSVSSKGTWSGISISQSGEVFEENVNDIQVVDSGGSLGAFAAGYLFGCLHNGACSGLRYGNAAAALTYSVPGSLNWFTRQDLVSQIEGTVSRLQR